MTRPERGQYGNTRGKERQRRKRDARLLDKPRSATMQDIAAERRALDERIAREAANPVLGEVEGARYTKLKNAEPPAMTDAPLVTEYGSVNTYTDWHFEFPIKKTEWLSFQGDYRAKHTWITCTVPFPDYTIQELPRPDANGNGQWTLTQARDMFRQGYNIVHVLLATGWGISWFADDFEFTHRGYMMPQEED